MTDILIIILKWAVPFCCSAVVTWAVTYAKMINKKNKELKELRDNKIETLADGVQCLLRAEIIRNHDKYLDRGYCPIYAKEALKRAYAAYHDLHGNDVATQLYNQTMALPTEAKEGEEQ